MSTHPRTAAHHRARRLLTLNLVALLVASPLAVASPRGEYATPSTVARHGESSKGPSSPAGRRAQARRSVGFSPGFELLHASDSELRRDLAGVRALGARRVRIDVSWALVERSPGHLDWAVTDRVVRAARAAGLHVLGVLCYEPSWARVEAPGAPPSFDPGRFARFAGAAAKRYRGAVSAWEIWNEPNLERFWGPQPDPVAYARLVEAAAPRIKAHAPEAEVVVGALAPAVDAPDGSEVAPETFLRAFYASVASLQLFDAVSIHPYSYPAMPDGGESWNTFHRLPAIHGVMRGFGDGRTRLWLTEYGAPTGRSDQSVSQRQQATMMVKAVREARRRAVLGPIYLYSYRDRAVAPHDPEANFGVVRHDWRPKPAYRALRRVLRAG